MIYPVSAKAAIPAPLFLFGVRALAGCAERMPHSSLGTQNHVHMGRVRQSLQCTFPLFPLPSEENSP